MSLLGERTFVGFGLGAIQAGLFLYESFISENFKRLVVAEVVPDAVRQVRENRGYLTVNIAYLDRIEPVCFGPIEVYNPHVEADRQKLLDALFEAHEIATAVPGIRYYATSSPASLGHMLAVGFSAKLADGGPAAVLYAAENHNHAAEILEELVKSEMQPEYRKDFAQSVRFLNTVIGKMSGVITGPPEIKQYNLTPMTPGSERAFLVEAFNKILITRISSSVKGVLSNFQRGITAFVEKDDLLPFEEAKLYGHNATHALAAYLGALLGIGRIAEIPRVPGLMDFLRKAFISESGSALIHRYAGMDPLFTLQGYTAYADDLLERMTNPWLADTVERVGRDIERKLGWNDRLVGTIRLCICEGIEPHRFALGAAAALVRLNPGYLTQDLNPEQILLHLWKETNRDQKQETLVVGFMRSALERIRYWWREGSENPNLLLGGW